VLSWKASADGDRYKYWGSGIDFNPPSVHYDEIMSDDKGVGAWTAKIVRRSPNSRETSY
jgi:hypothetical protein